MSNLPIEISGANISRDQLITLSLEKIGMFSQYIKTENEPKVTREFKIAENAFDLWLGWLIANYCWRFITNILRYAKEQLDSYDPSVDKQYWKDWVATIVQYAGQKMVSMVFCGEDWDKISGGSAAHMSQELSRALPQYVIPALTYKVASELSQPLTSDVNKTSFLTQKFLVEYADARRRDRRAMIYGENCCCDPCSYRGC